MPDGRRRRAGVQAAGEKRGRGADLRRQRLVEDRFLRRDEFRRRYSLPVVLCVINNGWAISVPRRHPARRRWRRRTRRLACLQVDGNDLVAVLEADAPRARTRARATKGGSVIEFMTYRLHDHTTADDARRYRNEDEVKAAWLEGTVPARAKFLTGQKLWTSNRKNWVEECGKLVDVEINAYLETPVQPVERCSITCTATCRPRSHATRQAIAAEGRA